jgi:hypothetical protein
VANAGSGQFDRQWQAVEPTADPNQGGGVRLRDAEGGVDRLGPRREEAYGAGGLGSNESSVLGIGDVERRDWEDPFVRDPEERPAGGQHRQAGVVREKLRDPGRGVDDLLKVVEDEQEPTITQEWPQPGRRPARGRSRPEPVRYGCQQQGRIADGGELDVADTVKGGRDVCRRLDRQARLADATGTGQRHEAHARLEEEVADSD